LIIKKILYWMIGFILFSGLSDLVLAQTYVEGDFVEDFGAEICYNGDGYWSYDSVGHNKVVFIASFATW
jgi:hypothetical protein